MCDAVGISLKPQHLRRYKDIAWLLLKHGRSDLLPRAGLEDALSADERPADGAEPAEARSLADDLERLGPTFIKLGQLLSTRPDLLPPAYVEALSRLQDKVAPFSFNDVERIVSTELGVRLSKAFASFDATPVAAASLGQVHRATLRGDRVVAVKVQRPEIRDRVVEDLEVLEEIAEFLDAHTETGQRVDCLGMVAEFRRSLLRELDYRQEAQHLIVLGASLRDLDALVVPQPVEDYTTSRVLTMDYVRGTKITTLSPVVRLELPGERLAEQLFRAYLRQILIDGFFHADPHPGNILVTGDGRLALIDLGMVARITPRLQDHLVQLLLAISEGRVDAAVDVAIKLGERRPDFDQARLSRDVAEIVGRHQHARAEQIQIGRTVLDVTRLSAAAGLRLPSELTMLGKALLNLDEVGRILDPGFEPNEAIRRNAADILRQRLMKSSSPGNLFSAILETKDFVERLPARVNRLLDALADNRLEVKVNAIDERQLTEGFQKIANRITMGLVLAALIVGAAMLIQVDTAFRIWGYPGLAIILFLLAAGGGVALMASILFRDR